jgi:Asp-tRNA(Asn)/Glu-tRNA(Gln) amidotransferase A subunit family amidase
MAWFAGTGLTATIFPGVLWAQANAQEKITKEMVKQAEEVAGLEFTDAERELMVEGLTQNRTSIGRIHAVNIPNSVPPATRFDPVVPGRTPPPLPAGYTRQKITKLGSRTRSAIDKRPPALEQLAFWPVHRIAELVRKKQVKPSELTRMYLERLKKHGPRLEAVVTLTEERALKQAADADREIAVGRYRGPLHGIPWGAKDLLAAKGYPTTWGSVPFKEQLIDEDATVVQRLDEAGAILVAKLTLGELAWGDVWFGGTTKNPWNLEQGSSGSSAGPAAATVAGLVGFAIGSETLGSIVSPSTRTGCSGLRPTFGRVSRAGAMALSWSMDKLGPMARSAEDCALIFNAIYGSDGKDLSVHDTPFHWSNDIDVSKLRVGYLKSAFDVADRPTKTYDDNVLDVLRKQGMNPQPVELEKNYPVGPLTIVLNAEAAAAFDELTRSGKDDTMKRQIANAWPNVFRQSQLIPAVAYIQANRIRTMLIEETEKLFDTIDVLVTPSFGGDVLTRTNLTGHPTVVVPSGFTDKGAPVSISFVGRLWGETAILAAAKAFQDYTDFEKRIPPLFAPGV